MRFILLAFALIGVVFYISNPQAFGVKKKFEFSVGGQVTRNETGGANFDFSKIGDFGVEMYEKFTATPDDSDSGVVATAANVEAETTLGHSETQILSSISTPDLDTYTGQMAAISRALQAEPTATAAQMQTAMQACLTTESPEQLTNYFVGLVQVVAQTAQLPQAQQADSFKQYSAPLTQALRGWLQFLPEDQRVANTLVLQQWAAQPKALVACNLAWLSTP
ncbi:MAG TPA: hypothetical protein EYG79_08210 [Rhodobacteraceae bacterium]|nr:hypothetical protein [Paracoccaceae bacterium]